MTKLLEHIINVTISFDLDSFWILNPSVRIGKKVMFLYSDGIIRMAVATLHLPMYRRIPITRSWLQILQETFSYQDSRSMIKLMHRSQMRFWYFHWTRPFRMVLFTEVLIALGILFRV
jgi:hypothetical protein